MAVHKRSNGELRICILCKLGEHHNCISRTAAFDNAKICHCTTCWKPCTRPECQPKNLALAEPLQAS